MKEMYMKELNGLVRDYLDKNNISRSDLAKSIGIHNQALSRTLNSNGKIRFESFVQVLEAIGYVMKFEKVEQQSNTVNDTDTQIDVLNKTIEYLESKFIGTIYDVDIYKNKSLVIKEINYDRALAILNVFTYPSLKIMTITNTLLRNESTVAKIILLISLIKSLDKSNAYSLAIDLNRVQSSEVLMINTMFSLVKKSAKNLLVSSPDINVILDTVEDLLLFHLGEYFNKVINEADIKLKSNVDLIKYAVRKFNEDSQFFISITDIDRNHILLELDKEERVLDAKDIDKLADTVHALIK